MILGITTECEPHLDIVSVLLRYVSGTDNTLLASYANILIDSGFKHLLSTPIQFLYWYLCTGNNNKYGHGITKYNRLLIYAQAFKHTKSKIKLGALFVKISLHI